MQRTNILITTIVGVLIGGLLMLGMVISFAPRQVLADALGQSWRFGGIPTNTKVDLGVNTSALLIATSTARSYAIITNNSANTVYISLGRDAVGSNGIRLNANGGSYEINAQNLYFGAIYGIASTSSNVDITVSP